MLPTVDAVYPAAKAVFWPWLRYGLRWTIEGGSNIPTQGPTILASNHVSYLDPVTLAWVADQRDRRIRFLAKAELFKNPALGALLRAAHQIPVYRGTADSSGALSAAVDALRRGECVTVFPEGTISEDFEPMRGKSGTARLALASGIPVVPVGLWGTHRILTKGRKPHLQWGVPQVAVVGTPVPIGPDERPREATLRIMDAITECVSRARAIYPEHPRSDADTDAWWWRDPETANAHRRPA
jgi:1-acyl-sn-glycerol-3-phosphate acyltransferase